MRAAARSRPSSTASAHWPAHRSSRGTATCTSARCCAAGDRFVVTDFDGNPVLPAPQRMLPIPAALDVAGHVPVAGARRDRRPQVHRHSTPPHWPTSTGPAARRSSTPTRRRLAELGHADLYDAGSAARLPDATGAARDHLCRTASSSMDVRPRRGPARSPRRRDADVKPDGFARRPAPQTRGAAAARRDAGRRQPVGGRRCRQTSSEWSCSAWGPRRTPAASPPPGCARVGWSPPRSWPPRDCSRIGGREHSWWRRRRAEARSKPSTR